MGKDQIYQKATALVRKTGTRLPELIAKEIGIKIYDESSFKKLLGMYTFRWNHRMMFLNSNMEYYLRQMVIAHELGHDALHREIAKASGKGLQEFSLFDIKSKTEYEANAFAAHILLDNNRVCEMVKSGFNAVQASRLLGVDVNLMMIKLKEMNRMGYNLNIPYKSDSKFLGRLDCGTSSCCCND